MVKLNIFENLNINSSIKLLRKGQIVKLYEQMYHLAHKLAVSETERTDDFIMRKLLEGKTPEYWREKFTIDYLEKSLDYYEKRFKYHINKMMELIIKRSEQNK